MPRASPSSTAAATSGWPCPSRLAPNDMQKSMYSLPSTSQMREPFAARRHERPPGAAVQRAAAVTPPGSTFWMLPRSTARSASLRASAAPSRLSPSSDGPRVLRGHTGRPPHTSTA